uniref:Uncharacterized protein n=1 Tax=Nelumbo nucifera TaxID=4432 RepID=A0A822ZNH8_NELNU|nr:TPA_asm: hypothetical protein HUJ06_016394 [Nelumbo nucifera]
MSLSTSSPPLKNCSYFITIEFQLPSWLQTPADPLFFSLSTPPPLSLSLSLFLSPCLLLCQVWAHSSYNRGRSIGQGISWYLFHDEQSIFAIPEYQSICLPLDAGGCKFFTWIPGRPQVQQSVTIKGDGAGPSKDPLDEVEAVAQSKKDNFDRMSKFCDKLLGCIKNLRIKDA